MVKVHNDKLQKISISENIEDAEGPNRVEKYII